MCELMGMSANTPTDVCFSLTGLLRRGGDTGPHKDGWGITFYSQNSIQTFRDTLSGSISPIAQYLSNHPIKSYIVISHIRQANVGGINVENTHPFTRQLSGQTWTYAHNGQLEQFQDFQLGEFSPDGNTDSEHSFCYILNHLNDAQADITSPQRWAEVMRTCCERLREKGVFNILCSNGQALFAYCSTKLYWITRRAPFGTAHLSDEDLTIDFSQYTSHRDIVSIVATEPLTDDERWQAMEPGESVLFINGERTWHKSHDG